MQKSLLLSDQSVVIDELSQRLKIQEEVISNLQTILREKGKVSLN